ncbi:MAG: hypothetical protein UU85_C0001G0131 [Candidatus Wolfebacteria bacterium GW2011_GWA2_42_10]|uniref:Type IV pilus modification protein PilV n=2 Tax=Candidatus Wolfeibacteriota TaxID=1752735 RepID=A0A0G0ZUP1_9BACT|nr:MAG: hypothetical protein UU38_C0003G0191 [Candidatus Wolfebacteria bacterium GW2011_GWB1_41_12]KKS25701.1 MAG: hypothetical protein UU85_C0001G0131 [Candidatus Wolfebacteria bacterium GW2011_GWA2_42_10]KKT56367.1 MAG: hypothetical protein UW50_C0002G0044 [Candidatus Wolfebacteria bacterium GW2011_GWA1_44_24]
MTNSNEKGYLLIEAMVAATLLIVGFLGVLGLVSQSLGLSRFVSDEFAANYLAMEGVEVVKNLIDANTIKNQPWNQGFSSEKCYEIDYNTSDIGSATEVRCPDASSNFISISGKTTPFKRTVHIVPVSADEIKVNSIVKWSGRGGGKFEINMEDHFFNWRP